MKKILTFSFILSLYSQIGFGQQTPWGAFPETSYLSSVTYYKIFDGVGRINGTYLEIGDYVGALNEDGKLAGFTQITQLVGGQLPVFTLQVYQDSNNTSLVEGPQTGENYSIQFYDASTDAYYHLNHFGPWTTAIQDGEQADGDNGSNWNAIQQVAPPLAIELLYFSGKEADGAIQLQWATVAEKDHAYFTVEKSINGRDFSAIGRVESLGDNVQKQTYGLVDKTPFTGLNYYRLKNTSLSGKVDYSEVISVLIERSTPTTISFYPNPVSNYLNVEVSSNYEEEMLHLQLFDVTGRVVLSQKLEMTNSLKHSVPVHHLAKGAYVVKIVGQTYTQSQKITVK